MLAVPLVGLTLVMVSVSPSTSLSLTSTGMVTRVSSGVVAASFTAIGASLTAVTVTVISAVAVPPLPSLIVYPILAVPTKFVAGVNTTLVPEMLAVPLVGLTLVMVSVSPSTSLSLTSTGMVTRVSSGVVAASFTAIGASLTAVTVTVINAVAVPPLPSLIVYPILAVPTKFMAGVKMTFVPETLAVPLVGLTLVIVNV